MKKISMAAALIGLVLTACSGGQQTAAESSAPSSHTASDKLNIYNWSDYVDPATLEARSESRLVGKEFWPASRTRW